ncbi:hypothetical protein ACK32U_16595, partial [Aeromonas dhakensis]|uniref:hypothetical protein n=1 Tax=Aeromonas dhakensis TaxID=196024 RepID=UPI00398A34B9
MDYLTKADIIFSDLDEIYFQIMNSRRKPKHFRHLFEQYIVKSQQLTDVMRREFKNLTGRSWSASDFLEWTLYTKILKSLRNAALHGEGHVRQGGVNSVAVLRLGNAPVMRSV